MKSIKTLVSIVVILSLTTGCQQRHLQANVVNPVFPMDKIELMREMAGFAILYGTHNHVSQFTTESISNRDTRLKMEELGTKTNIYYKSINNAANDSTVVFQHEYATANWHYTIEYWYDFALYPRQRVADSVLNYENRLVRVNDRIFYRIDRYKRERFPMM